MDLIFLTFLYLLNSLIIFTKFVVNIDINSINYFKTYLYNSFKFIYNNIIIKINDLISKCIKNRQNLRISKK